MKKSHTFQLKSLPGTIVIAMLGAAGLAATAQAQTSGTWINTTPTGDTGDWSDPAKWTATGVPNGGGNATFGAYDNDRTVTVDSAVYTINKLSIAPRTSGFTAKAFALDSSGGSLAIGSGGIDIDNGGTVSIATPIEVTANQIWNALSNPAGSATFSAPVGGTGKITRASGIGGGSVFTFTSDNTFTGGFEQSALNSPVTRIGSDTILNSGVIESGPLGTGTITLNGGTLSSNGATERILHNNFVVSGAVSFGRSGSNGALTLTDVDLNTPSTFTLGSATDGAASNVRVGSNLTLDQVIAESGGSGQGILFSAISGTPVVTLSRTKTAGGPILAGGVNLVLANEAANSGSLFGVNGAISATGLNKFSAGALVVDGTNLTATDLTNFSEVTGGKVTIFNNGRLSLETTPTQAEAAALVTLDSEFRLGLGSGSSPATVTENYDQSALGNGKAGLVSASTGTITYSGTLSPGLDSTFRIGGGLGTLALGSALTGSNINLRVEGGGTLTSAVNHDYTGTTHFTGGATTLSGANGAFSGTSGLTLSAASTLNIENGGAGNNRLPDTAPITVKSGSLVFNSNVTTTAFSETAGNFVVSGGVNQINFRTTPAASTVRTVSLGALSRENNSLLLVRGDALGGTGTARNEIKFTATPTLIGGGGAAGSTNQSIIPWARGVFDGNPSSAPGRFATYDSNGLRTLSPVTEMVQANATTKIDQAIAANAGSTTLNMRWNPAAAGNTTILNTASTTATVNALWVGNSGSNTGTTYSLNAGTINVTSGAVHFQHDAFQNLTAGSGTLAFGDAEAVITNNAGGFLTTVATTLTGTGGLSVYTLNGGGISLGSVTNNISGTFTVGGNGFVAVDQNARFGNAANTVVHAGGELRFFAGFTTTRSLVLQGGVGNNTLANANVFTHNWNGDISGDGRLRLINNASTPSNVGYGLGGNNTYTGGTQIEGINVAANSDSSFGTGTVSLLGGSFGAGFISFNSDAPAIGGLRGTGGTVTINPAGSSATLTIGSANENGLFAGNITQGAGKTGSLAKVGSGKLVLAGNNSYTGNTTVSNGTLSLSQAGFDDASVISVGSTAFLELTHTSTDVVGDFKINGVSQPAGVYGAVGSGAPNTTPRITGTGRIQTLAIVSDPYDAWADDNSLEGVDREKTSDPDFDGLVNLVEFALNSDPNSGAASGRSGSQVTTVSGNEALVLTIPVLDGAVFSSVPGPSAVATVGSTTYIIEGSNDLVNFDQGVTEVDPAPDLGLIAPAAGWSPRTFRLNGNVGGGTPRGPKGFLRVRIIDTP